MTSHTDQIEHAFGRSTADMLLKQQSPGMKMLLGNSTRFEWKTINDNPHSDMVLTLRGDSHATLAINDVRAILAACDTLGMKGWLHGDYSRLASYKIHGKIDSTRCADGDTVPRGGVLITPLDFGAERITAAVDVSQFSLKVSAQTYREMIAPRQKALAIAS